MKHRLAFAFLVLSLGTGPAMAQPFSAAPTGTSHAAGPFAPSLITVNGKAVISVAPDQYIFHVRLQNEDAEAEAALAHNNSQFAQLQNLLKGFDVPNSSFQVTDVNLSHPYREGHKLRSFEAVRQVSFVLAQTSQKNPLLLEFAKRQIGEVTNAVPSLKDPISVREKARVLALQQAQKKARTMAATLGQSIGKAFHIEESPPDFSHQNSNSNMLIRSGEESEPSGNGQISVSASVRVSFLLQ